jgi:hypothetical protein
MSHNRAYETTVISRLYEMGAKKVRVVRGGKHRKLLFEHNGAEHKVSIASTPSDNRAAKNLISDIKRRLGITSPMKQQTLDAHAQQFAIEQTLEARAQTLDAPTIGDEPDAIEPTSETSAAQSDALIAEGTVAWYPTNKCVEFKFPNTVTRRLGDWEKFGIQPQDDGTWEIFPSDNGSAIRKKDRPTNILTWGFRKGAHSNSAPFRATPAEYLVVDDRLLVRLLAEPIPYDAPRPDRSDVEVPAVVTEPPRSITSEDPAVACRAVLAGIAEVHRTTAYRLAQCEDGTWEFRAPPIRL